MPTWDNIKEFNKPEYKGIEIIYSTPFYNAKMDKVSLGITTYFKEMMFARPSDMVFRGYEVTWKYAKLLMQYRNDICLQYQQQTDTKFSLTMTSSPY